MSKEITNLLAEAYSLRVHSIKESITLTKKALEISKTLNDTTLIAQSKLQLSFLYMINSDYDDAITLANKALQLYTKLGNTKGVADAKYNIASVYYKRDNLHLGLRYLLECLLIYKELNDYGSLSKCYKSLGAIYEFFEEIDEAINAYQLAIENANRVGDINMSTNAQNPLSGIYNNQGKVAEAMELIEASIAGKKSTGDIRGLAFAYYGRGKIYTTTKQYVLAEEDLLNAIAIHTKVGEKLGLGMAHLKLASLYVQQHKLAIAKEQLLQSLQIGIANKIHMISTKSLLRLYEISKMENSTDEALAYLEKYHKIQNASFNNQARLIANSYEMITKMQTQALEDKYHIERMELKEKQKKAEYEAKVKQDFLSTMSHEIRTPLNAIITISHLLKERENEEEQLLSSLKIAANNLLLLINDILDFNKLEVGNVVLNLSTYSLHQLAHNVSVTFQNVAAEKGLQLSVTVSDNITTNFLLDEIKLLQVLNNLVSNAIKFTNKGSVNVTIGCTEIVDGKHRIHFSVKDTGEGIPEEFRKELFKPFTQADSYITKYNKGSGLGLAIVKKLVELFGGTIAFTSTTGKGSHFYFDILLAPCEAATTEQIADITLDNISVLLAEDNTINQLVAKQLITNWGAAVECVSNGKEAIQIAAKKKFDIILMDIHMPLMDGYEAAKVIKTEQGLNMQTPIYALTADIMAGTTHKNQQVFAGYLSKPIERNNLYTALQKVMV